MRNVSCIVEQFSKLSRNLKRSVVLWNTLNDCTFKHYNASIKQIALCKKWIELPNFTVNLAAKKEKKKYTAFYFTIYMGVLWWTIFWYFTPSICWWLHPWTIKMLEGNILIVNRYILVVEKLNLNFSKVVYPGYHLCGKKIDF